MKKTHPTCQASKESLLPLQKSKSQNSTAQLLITWFVRTFQRLSLLSSSFGYRKSLLGRALERTLQVQTLLMPFVTLSTLSTAALKPPVKASTFSYLIAFSATRVGPLVASASSLRTSHLLRNSLPLNKYLKHTVEKERPLRPLPHPTYLK